MPFRNDVTSILSLAQTVADDFSCAPRVFSEGEQAAMELTSELRSYQQFHSARGHPNNQADFESSLTANLRPCRDALDAMREIRQKYGPGGRDGKLGIADSVRWRLDETRFRQQAADLRRDTARLRELVQELQRSAVVSSMTQQQQQHQPNRDGGQFRASAFQTQTTISVYPYPHSPQHIQGGTSAAASFTSNSQNENQSQTPTEMCPNGSGCRTPRCHLNYLHPRAPSCPDGRNCGLRNCEKWHPKSPLCPTGAACPMVGCDKAHPWPGEPPPPAAFPVSEGSFSSLNTSMTSVSSTMGSQSQPQPQQPSDWGSRAASTTSQLPWRGTGTTARSTGPATQPGGPIVVMGRQFYPSLLS